MADLSSSSSDFPLANPALVADVDGRALLELEEAIRLRQPEEGDDFSLSNSTHEQSQGHFRLSADSDRAVRLPQHKIDVVRVDWGEGHRIELPIELAATIATAADEGAEKQAEEADVVRIDWGGAEIELPAELAAMIAAAEEEDDEDDGLRYFPVYGRDEMCSSKHRSEFGAWEDSFRNIEECCGAVFWHDYEDCVGNNTR